MHALIHNLVVVLSRIKENIYYFIKLSFLLLSQRSIIKKSYLHHYFRCVYSVTKSKARRMKPILLQTVSVANCLNDNHKGDLCSQRANNCAKSLDK